MQPLHHLSLAIIAFLFSGCAKDATGTGPDLGFSSSCGTDGARLQANAGASSFCASAQVLSVCDGTSAMISGFDLTGSSIVLQIDDLGVGVHPISKAMNSVLFMQNGASFATGQNAAGELSIVQHDAAARSLKGSFEAELINAKNGDELTVSGSFDVTYRTED